MGCAPPNGQSGFIGIEGRGGAELQTIAKYTYCSNKLVLVQLLQQQHT